MRVVAVQQKSAALVRSSLEFLSSHKVDLALLLALTAGAAVLRLIALGDIPPGLHGDEAIAGLEARSLLDHGTLLHGSLEPYSHGARGVPAGTFYWTAAVLGVAGESAATIRLAYALLGIATVSVSYAAYRVMFGRTIAVLATLLLAFSAWHLHYSRVAFIPIGSPLMQMATLFFLFLGVRRDSRWLFAAAGACLGAGIYTYQAFIVFAISVAAVLAIIGAVEYRERLAAYTKHVATLLGVALLVGLPMASFAWNNPDLYKVRYQSDSVTKTEGYRNADTTLEKAGVLLDRERDYLRSLVDEPLRDPVDASGIFPFVDLITLALLATGAIIAIARLRRAQYAAVLVILVVIGISPALAEGGWYRRTLGLVPLLSLFAALPLALLWNEGAKRDGLARALAGLAIVAVVVSVSAINLGRYFGSYDSSDYARQVLRADLVEASEFMADLPEDSYVLYYDHRNTFDYVSRQFIAPGIEGEGRTRSEGPVPSLAGDRRRDLVYVFVGSYAELLPQVQQLYPGGTSHTERDGEAIAFAAYLLPHSVSTEGADQRDRLRQQDLEMVRRALDQHRQANGSFPSTDGAVQTLCALDADAACQVKELLDPLPSDPLSAESGSRQFYFYASDGQTYSLYAQREGTSIAVCNQHPTELRAFDSLLCLRGP